MTMRGWLAGWMVVVGLVSGAASAPAPVDPTTLAGAWAGTWENRSFNPHPTGTVSATVAVPDANTIAISYSATGGVFGGCVVAPTVLTLVKGTDFTDKAVEFTRQDATFGAVTVKSKKRGQKLIARGTGTCGGGGPSWNAKAKHKSGVFTVKMKIRLPSKIAKTTIILTRQAA